jgi:hypothetical protein
LAVKVGDVATPDASVVTVAVVLGPGKVPLAGVPGAVKVTDTLGTGLFPLSRTVALRGFVNAVPSGVIWPLPESTVMELGAPALLVSENGAGLETPLTEAFTV